MAGRTARDAGLGIYFFASLCAPNSDDRELSEESWICKDCNCFDGVATKVVSLLAYSAANEARARVGASGLGNSHHDGSSCWAGMVEGRHGSCGGTFSVGRL